MKAVARLRLAEMGEAADQQTGNPRPETVDQQFGKYCPVKSGPKCASNYENMGSKASASTTATTATTATRTRCEWFGNQYKNGDVVCSGWFLTLVLIHASYFTLLLLCCCLCGKAAGAQDGDSGCNIMCEGMNGMDVFAYNCGRCCAKNTQYYKCGKIVCAPCCMFGPALCCGPTCCILYTICFCISMVMIKLCPPVEANDEGANNVEANDSPVGCSLESVLDFNNDVESNVVQPKIEKNNNIEVARGNDNIDNNSLPS